MINKAQLLRNANKNLREENSTLRHRQHIITDKPHCDYCNSLINWKDIKDDNRWGTYIAGLTYAEFSIDRMGSGGDTIKDKCLCKSCSEKFIEFLASLKPMRG